MSMQDSKKMPVVNSGANKNASLSPTSAATFQPKRPFLIGVAGGTASGKTSVCHKIMEKLGQNEVDHTERQCVVISQDSFYNVLSKEQKAMACKGEFNFDHPDAFDNELLQQTLSELISGKRTQIPQYDFVTHSRTNQTTSIHCPDVILIEGILIFYFKALRDLFNMKLFVDTDSDTRLARRILRDINERGRDLENVLHQYISFVKPAFEEFCFPTKKYADVIIPRGADNTVAIDLIVQHIQDLLRPSREMLPKRTRHSSDTVSLLMGRPPLQAPATGVAMDTAVTMATSSITNRPH